MSDDIVTRLRTKYGGQLPILTEAADEIERLRKLIIDYHNVELAYRNAWHDDDAIVLKEEWIKAWKAVDREVAKYENNR